VDDEHGLIVDSNVTNHANDLGEPSNMVKRSKEALGVEELSMSADTGNAN